LDHEFSRPTAFSKVKVFFKYTFFAWGRFVKTFQGFILALILSFAVILPLQAASGNKAGEGLYISPTLGLTSFDSELNYDDTTTFSLGLGYQFNNPLAVELVVSTSSTEIDNRNSTEVDYFQIRFDALYNLPQLKNWNPYLVGGIGDGVLEVPNDKNDATEFNAGVGVTTFINDNWAFRGDVRLINLYDISMMNTQFNVGVSYYFSGTKLPSVKWPTKTRKEPKKEVKKKEVKQAPQEVVRKPQTVSGPDSTPKTKRARRSESAFLAADYDGDGVSNVLDRCKDTPLGVRVDNSGCPADSDMDGVGDFLDRCPRTPKGTKVDNEGCAGDSDSDGVKDNKDDCPNTITGASVDLHGCRIQVTKTIKISMQLKFKSGQAEILPEHDSEIAKVGNFMLKHPKSTAVIEGHTDSSGDAAFNLQLSKYRAERVRAELIRNYRVDPRRIVAKGYGESRPIADNSTVDGRNRNRRVIAVIRAKMDK